MKKITLYLLFVLSIAATQTAFAQHGAGSEKGIKMSTSDWKTVVAQAKKEKKIIFLDCYTTWCGPCKMLAAKTFTNDSVAEFYNKNFINVSMDMESGEGIGVATQYGVRVYPTLLFISGEEEILHQAAGFMTAAAFLRLGSDALNPEKQIGTLDRRFAKGERSAAFLYNLAYAKRDAYADAQAPAKAYLEVEKDWSQTKARKMIFDIINDPAHPAFKYMVDNRPSFNEEFGEGGVNEKISQTLLKQAFDIVGADPKNGFTKVENLYAQYFGAASAPAMLQDFKLQYYQKTGDQKNYLKLLGDVVDKSAAKDWERYNEAAWSFYENFDDAASLKRAFAWSEKSIAINSNYFNNDTAAALQYKLKNKAKAKKYADTAIELGAKYGNDTSETKALLVKIKKM